MIKDKRLKEIVDYESSLALFNNVEVKGGINYFLWDKKYNGKCKVTHIRANGKKYESNRFLAYKDLDVFVNDNILFEIIKRNKLYESKDTFEKLVSSRGPYGWKLNSKISLDKTSDDVIIYGFKRKGFVNKNLIKDNKHEHEYKIFISLAYGGNRQVLNKPFIPDKNSICSETYLSIGPFKSENETINALNYMRTKFFRAMVYALKKTQHGTRKVYRFVPLQDFSKPWTDEELYKKYKLTQEEINYIEDNIDPTPSSDN